MIDHVVALNEQAVPITKACAALGVARSSYYYHQQPVDEPTDAKPRPAPPRALSVTERAAVRQTLDSDRFADQAPREVYATLLDEGNYLCSISTMYRVLNEHDEVKERRNQLRHPQHVKPQLLAEQPNQLWSWDITKLRTADKLVYFFLYVILDVFSRYVVGWMVAEAESADLAMQVIQHSYQQQQIVQDQLTLHADRGGPMVARTTAQLLDRLGVQKTHSRPYTPDDNPFSESQFKTMKYRPDFPKQFDSIDAARAWAQRFFHWYNHEHHHSGLVLLTPAQVHTGQAAHVIQQRNQVLHDAYQRHPERFVRGMPNHPALPPKVWINPPKPDADELQLQG